MDYAHAYVNLVMSQKPTDAVKEWVEAQKRPYEKLMRGFEAGISDFLKNMNFDYSLLPKVSEIVIFTFSDGSIEERPQNLEKFRSDQNLLSSIVKELRELNCPVWDGWPHPYKSSDGEERYNLYLAMPLQKPNPSFGQETVGMPPQPRTLPNFEGKVTFLAYLMRKGYVTEADAPRGEDPRAPFSAAMFGFAKTRAKTLTLENP